MNGRFASGCRFFFIQIGRLVVGRCMDPYVGLVAVFSLNLCEPIHKHNLKDALECEFGV